MSIIKIDFESEQIDKYFEQNEVIYDDVPYENAKDMFNEAAFVLSGDWLDGYQLPDKIILTEFLSTVLTTANPEFAETTTIDDSVLALVEFMKSNSGEIENEATGIVCIITNLDGNGTDIDGIRFNQGKVERLCINLLDVDGVDEMIEAFEDVSFAEDVDTDLLNQLFDRFATVQ